MLRHRKESKMNKLMFALLLAAVSFAGYADATNGPKRRRPPHPTSRPSGGIAEKPYEGKVFRVLNLQSDYAGEKLHALTRDIRLTALLPIECVDSEPSEGKCPFEVAESLVSSDGVGAGAIVVCDSRLPIELVSPDRRWGILNIAPLKADAPDDDKFEKRFVKVYWGIIARTLGAGMSSFPGCVLVPFTDLKGLDAINAVRPCPEPFNKMIDTGESYGIKTISIATYRTACQQGWAPAPTNDVQRAIWEQVKAEQSEKPTNPIRIVPGQKPSGK